MMICRGTLETFCHSQHMHHSERHIKGLVARYRNTLRSVFQAVVEVIYHIAEIHAASIDCSARDNRNTTILSSRMCCIGCIP